jgi:hypothetical protein
LPDFRETHHFISAIFTDGSHVTSVPLIGVATPLVINDVRNSIKRGLVLDVSGGAALVNWDNVTSLGVISCDSSGVTRAEYEAQRSSDG